MGDVGNAGDAGRASRIEDAVEREMRHRKRLLMLYAVLLLIPIGIAVLYLTRGVTERDIVRREVQTGLAPMQDTIRRAEPALQQVRQAADQISEQQARIEAFGEQQRALADQIRPLSEKLPEIEEVRVRLDQISEQADANRLEMRRLNERVSAVEPGDLHEIVRGQKELIQQLQKDVEALKVYTRTPAKERVRVK